MPYYEAQNHPTVDASDLGKIHAPYMLKSTSIQYLSKSSFEIFFKSQPQWDTALQSHSHTSYLSFILHGQNFGRIKFTPKNAFTNYKKQISRQNSVNQYLLGQATKKVCKTTHSV